MKLNIIKSKSNTKIELLSLKILVIMKILYMKLDILNIDEPMKIYIYTFLYLKCKYTTKI